MPCSTQGTHEVAAWTATTNGGASYVATVITLKHRQRVFIFGLDTETSPTPTTQAQHIFEGRQPFPAVSQPSTMSDLQKLSHVEERAEIHRQYFYKLCHIKAQVDRLHWPTLNDEQLQSMSVRIIDDLDVDEASPCDFGPRYFAPLPRSRLPDLIEQGEANLRDWYPKCAGNIDNIDEPPCLRFHEAMHRITWFNRSYGSACYGPFYDESDWELQYDNLIADFCSEPCTNRGQGYGRRERQAPVLSGL